MERDNLIFTLSGARGIIGKSFDAKIAKKIAIAYGLRLNRERYQVKWKTD
jgi:phosphomannomutase